VPSRPGSFISPFQPPRSSAFQNKPAYDDEKLPGKPSAAPRKSRAYSRARLRIVNRAGVPRLQKACRRPPEKITPISLRVSGDKLGPRHRPAAAPSRRPRAQAAAWSRRSADRRWVLCIRLGKLSGFLNQGRFVKPRGNGCPRAGPPPGSAAQKLTTQAKAAAIRRQTSPRSAASTSISGQDRLREKFPLRQGIKIQRCAERIEPRPRAYRKRRSQL